MLLQLFICLFCEFGLSVNGYEPTLAKKVGYFIISVFLQVSALASSYFKNFKLIFFFLKPCMALLHCNSIKYELTQAFWLFQGANKMLSKRIMVFMLPSAGTQ